MGSAAAAYLLDDGTQWGASPPVKVSFLIFFLGCQIHLMVQISPLQCLYSAASQTITHFMQQMVLSSSSMRHRRSSNGDSELFLSNSWITIGDLELKKTVCSPASVHILSWKTGVQNCLVTFVMF